MYDYQAPTSDAEWQSLAKDATLIHYNKLRHIRRIAVYSMVAAIAAAAIVVTVFMLSPKPVPAPAKEALRPTKSQIPQSATQSSLKSTVQYTNHHNVTDNLAPASSHAIPSSANTTSVPTPSGNIAANTVHNIAYTPSITAEPTMQSPTAPTPTKTTASHVVEQKTTTQTAVISESLTNDTTDYLLQDESAKSIPSSNKFFIPNAFTPNSDGLNDIFYIKANFNPVNYELIICSKDGQKLFTTRSIDIGWDGQYHGKIMPQGVYMYFIRYTDPLSEKSEVEKGQILLLP